MQFLVGLFFASLQPVAIYANVKRLLPITRIFKRKYAYLFQCKCKKKKAKCMQSNNPRISAAQISVVGKSRLFCLLRNTQQILNESHYYINLKITKFIFCTDAHVNCRMLRDSIFNNRSVFKHQFTQNRRFCSISVVGIHEHV